MTTGPGLAVCRRRRRHLRFGRRSRPPRGAAALLADPHPLVAAAAAVWSRPGVSTDGLRRWQDGLPGAVEVGDVPSQEVADGWAREHSLGLIDQFPLPVDSPVRRRSAAYCIIGPVGGRLAWCMPSRGPLVDGVDRYPRCCAAIVRGVGGSWP
ncbi:hypothetical protein FRACA_610012 [Frankia canadensis]|uniref:Uncharacterized protein n=1 Tax=Frankia canadensis TaxID=1836972 RepID=A0A2I2KZN9_9ACTN|nr:hypothetical protein FRACA_610012 [Frankia canadensis]SOU58421.1 hypothetical protein FRACA_610012 [Frankia canadensis]